MNISISSLEIELNKLLSEPLAAVFEREYSTFDKLTYPFHDIVLFGAGNLGRKILAGLRQIGIEPLAFADNNSDLWGKKVNDLIVLSPADAVQRFGHKATFVITIWGAYAIDRMVDRRKQLETLGCIKVISFGSLFWKYPDIFLPHYAFDLPHKAILQAEDIRKVFSLWNDDVSCHEYLAQLNLRILMDFENLPLPVIHDIYFPTDLLTIRDDETLIDCGAFDGDTIRVFLNKHTSIFKQIIAFEPDSINIQKLREYILTLPKDSKNKIIAYQVAVGNCKKNVRFNSTGTEASAVGSGETFVDQIFLDDVLSYIKPTYIKMDIEGSELAALGGAAIVISRDLPILAVSVYHKYDDLWKIPLKIHEISDQYHFFLRPHLIEGWDLVCYAIPENRLHIKI